MRLNYGGKICAFMIRTVWQKLLSEIYRRRANCYCRFHPSCSEYAALSFEKHGVIRGLSLTKSRLRRCVPENTDSCVDYP